MFCRFFSLHDRPPYCLLPDVWFGLPFRSDSKVQAISDPPFRSPRCFFAVGPRLLSESSCVEAALLLYELFSSSMSLCATLWEMTGSPCVDFFSKYDAVDDPSPARCFFLSAEETACRCGFYRDAVPFRYPFFSYGREALSSPCWTSI